MIIQASTPARSAVAAVIRIVVVFDAVALLFAGIVHLVGARISLGGAAFVEPPIIPVGVVESLAGVVFVVAAYALFLRRAWAWAVTLAAHLFAIAGFLLGLWATRLGTTPFNYDYHRVMLAVFVAGLILVLTPPARAALRTR